MSVDAGIIAGVVAAQPLIAAMRDLEHGYREAGDRTGDMIAALASGDFGRVQLAVAAQGTALRTIEGLEQRRRAAQTDLEARIGARSDPTTGAASPYSCSELLELLPPDEAQQLRAVRHDILLTLAALQSKHGQAAMMLQNAQAVIKRLVRASAPDTLGYGSRGEPTLAGQQAPHRPVRWA